MPMFKVDLIPLAELVPLTHDLIIKLCCWSTGLTERDLPMQYITSTKVYADKAQKHNKT